MNWLGVEKGIIFFVMLNVFKYYAPQFLSSCKFAFSIRVENSWILIRWLHQKPADQDLQYQKDKLVFSTARDMFVVVFRCYRAVSTSARG